MEETKQYDDFLNAFCEDQTSQIDKEYYAIEDDFYSRFGYRIPREMMPDSVTLDKIKEAMKKCIESGKDNLFELLGVKINNSYLY